MLRIPHCLDNRLIDGGKVDWCCSKRFYSWLSFFDTVISHFSSYSLYIFLFSAVALYLSLHPSVLLIYISSSVYPKPSIHNLLLPHLCSFPSQCVYNLPPCYTRDTVTLKPILSPNSYFPPCLAPFNPHRYILLHVISFLCCALNYEYYAVLASFRHSS
jgi:hypothetical protein